MPACAGQQPGDEAGEHVAGAGRRQPGRRVVVDGGAAVGRRDRPCRRPSRIDHRAASRRPARALQLRALAAASPNRRLNSPSCGVSTTGAVRALMAPNSPSGSAPARRRAPRSRSPWPAPAPRPRSARTRSARRHRARPRPARRARSCTVLRSRRRRRAGPISTALWRLSVRISASAASPPSALDHDRREMRGVDGGGVGRADDRDETGADAQRAARAQPCGARCSRPGRTPRRRGRACTCARRAGPGIDAAPQRRPVGEVCGADLVEHAAGMPMSATATSPHSARPGSSRCPGFRRKNVTVRVACTTGPAAAARVPSRPLGTSTASDRLARRVDGRDDLGRRARRAAATDRRRTGHRR